VPESGEEFRQVGGLGELDSCSQVVQSTTA
jgi:hypothetical protein